MKRAGAALLFLAAPLTAHAHSVGLSAGQYRWVGGGEAAVELTFARPEASSYLAAMKNEPDAELDQARAERFGALILEGLTARADGAACTARFVDARMVEGDGVAVRGRLACGREPELLEIELSFLEDLAPGHRHAAQGLGGGSPVEAFAHRGAKRLSIPIVAAARPKSAGGGFLRGLAAMSSSPLHALTLFGLLAFGGEALAGLGAYAFGCALALLGAGLGGANPAGRVLLPLSAVGAAWVAVESVLVFGQPDAARGRWRYAAFLGLLPGLHLLRAFEGGSADLVAFTSGVLASQVAIAAVALGAKRLLRKLA